jgi:hypothetical protein
MLFFSTVSFHFLDRHYGLKQSFPVNGMENKTLFQAGETKQIRGYYWSLVLVSFKRVSTCHRPFFYKNAAFDKHLV